MATTRQRRAGMNPPAYSADADDDRIYTEDDYAVADSELPADEWEAGADAYAEGSWTGDQYLPDEAFEPDQEEYPEEGEWSEEPLAPEEVPYPMGEGYAPLFEGADFDDELDPLSDELLTDEERAELRRSHWQLIAGLADFAGVILGTAVILLLVTLLVSLINWLVGDVSQSFILLQKHL